MMKRIAALLLASLAMLSIVGCERREEPVILRRSAPQDDIFSRRAHLYTTAGGDTLLRRDVRFKHTKPSEKDLFP